MPINKVDILMNRLVWLTQMKLDSGWSWRPKNYMENIIPFSFSCASEPAFSLLFYVGSNQCQSCGGQENAKPTYNGVCLDSRIHKFGIVSQVWVLINSPLNEWNGLKISQTSVSPEIFTLFSKALLQQIIWIRNCPIKITSWTVVH